MTRLILYLFLCLFISCNDHLKIERNNNPQGVADSQFVGTWKITAVTADVPWDYDGNGSPETNIHSTWSACEKDNLYTFVGDKTGTFKLNCSTTKPGSWNVVRMPFPQYLVYTPESLTPESEIVFDMTSVQFKSKILLTLSNGQSATITKIWDRQ